MKLEFYLFTLKKHKESTKQIRSNNLFLNKRNSPMANLFFKKVNKPLFCQASSLLSRP